MKHIVMVLAVAFCLSTLAAAQQAPAPEASTNPSTQHASKHHHKRHHSKKHSGKHQHTAHQPAT